MMLKIKRVFVVSLLLTCFFKVDVVSAQKINQFDKNGKRMGVWKKYHSNKRIRYIGKFINGKEVGEFKFYDIRTSKHPIAIKSYFEENDSVFVQFFTLKGKLQSEGLLYHKKRIGGWEYYFPNGKILSEESYIMGKLNNALTTYYPNGNVTENTMYKNGLKHGLSKKYAENGVLLEEVNYSFGKANGEAKYFDLKGQIKEEGTYKNGKRVGRWEFYMDGEVVSDKEKKKQNRYSKTKD